LITAGHGATQCPADSQMSASGGLSPIHRIKCNQLKDIDWLELKAARDQFNRVVADESEVFLPEMQQRHGSAPSLIGRILRDRLVKFPL
jgi:hypothetical protein